MYDDGRDEFRSFRVRVPRKVIVNSKVNSCPIPHAHPLTSTRVLPRGRLARYLFELVNPSDDEVAALRASDQIDGVFESQVPLSFTAIVAVGNVVRSAGRADLFRGGPCDLHDLECGPQSQSRVYLDKIDAMARLFLYASGNLDRSVIALCASNPSEGGATAIFVVVVSAKGTPGERPDLQAIAADIVHREELGPGIDVPNIDAEYKVVRSFDAAVNLLRDRYPVSCTLLPWWRPVISSTGCTKLRNSIRRPCWLPRSLRPWNSAWADRKSTNSVTHRWNHSASQRLIVAQRTRSHFRLWRSPRISMMTGTGRCNGCRLLVAR